MSSISRPLLRLPLSHARCQRQGGAERRDRLCDLAARLCQRACAPDELDSLRCSDQRLKAQVEEMIAFQAICKIYHL